MVDWSRPLVARNRDGVEFAAKVGQLNAGVIGRNTHWIWVYHSSHSNAPRPEGVWFDAEGYSTSREGWKIRNGGSLWASRIPQ